MKLSQKIQDIIDNPSTVEGTRHREALRVCAYLVGEGMPTNEVKAILEKAYPHMIIRQHGKEIDNMILGAMGLGLTPTADRVSKPIDRKKFKVGTYTAPVKSQEQALPVPIETPSRQFIEKLFNASESVCFTNDAKWDEAQGKWVIASAGVVMDRDKFAKKMDAAKNFNNPAGAWIRTNPTNGTKDSDVTDFRYTVIESDESTKEMQYAVAVKSNLPIAAIVDSGGKSLHTWIKIEATNREEFDERVAKVHALLSELIPDASMKNPSRWSRMPGIMRGEKMQSLLSWNIGAQTWDEWESLFDASELPVEQHLSDLAAFDRKNDVLNVLGNRWLCKGGSLLLQGQSGIGKSTLVMQMAITWAIGRDLFGIKPVKPLSISIIQAENDIGDMAEMYQDSKSAMKLTPEEDQLLAKNLRIFREQVRTADSFVKQFSNVALRTKADLIFVDPLLAYIGGDVSKTEVASQFFRNWINPVLEQTGAIACFVHHMGKPKVNADTKNMNKSDLAYAGLGSSELTNWGRETMTLVRGESNEFRLVLSKRDNRAGLSPEDKGEIAIKHSPDGQTWLKIQKTTYKVKLESDPIKKLKKLEGQSLAQVMNKLRLIGVNDYIKGKLVTDIFNFDTGSAVLIDQDNPY